MRQWLLNEERPLDIIPVGRIAVDFNPVDHGRPLSQSRTFKKYVGGSPANIAVGMARLGNAVGFIGSISGDAMGDFVEEYFKNEGIDTSHVVRCEGGESLGLTFTEMLSPTQSSILMYREKAADLMLSPESVDESYIKKARLLLISGTALAQSPSREACLKALAFAESTNTPVVFDIDYRAYTWKNMDEISIYTSLVAEKAEVIIGSREEFSLMERLTGLDGTDRNSADYWMGKKAKIVIIKHGKEGSSAYSEEGDFQVKPFPVEALKGFGGGDGYASAFLHGLLAGWEISKALEFGSASAAMLVASHACSEDMPSEEAVKAFIREKKTGNGE